METGGTHRSAISKRGCGLGRRKPDRRGACGTRNKCERSAHAARKMRRGRAGSADGGRTRGPPRRARTDERCAIGGIGGIRTPPAWMRAYTDAESIDIDASVEGGSGQWRIAISARNSSSSSRPTAPPGARIPSAPTMRRRSGAILRATCLPACTARPSCAISTRSSTWRPTTATPAKRRCSASCATTTSAAADCMCSSSRARPAPSRACSASTKTSPRRSRSATIWATPRSAMRASAS